jgi:hypothetical protein
VFNRPIERGVGADVPHHRPCLSVDTVHPLYIYVLGRLWCAANRHNQKSVSLHGSLPLNTYLTAQVLKYCSRHYWPVSTEKLYRIKSHILVVELLFYIKTIHKLKVYLNMSFHRKCMLIRWQQNTLHPHTSKSSCLDCLNSVHLICPCLIISQSLSRFLSNSVLYLYKKSLQLARHVFRNNSCVLGQ